MARAEGKGLHIVTVGLGAAPGRKRIPQCAAAAPGGEGRVALKAAADVESLGAMQSGGLYSILRVSSSVV